MDVIAGCVGVIAILVVGYLLWILLRGGGDGE